jgi:CRISPR-associated protein Cas2
MPERKTQSRIKTMWMFAMFDLPVDSADKRRAYTRFRKALIREGFLMIQYSIYIRYCKSRENSNTYFRHIKKVLPAEGQVRLLSVTDKQFSDMKIYFGKNYEKPQKKPEQLLLL